MEKIRKVEILTTDSGVLVMKKKERLKLKLAINGTYSKKAWEKLTFRSKKKKIVSTDKKGKLTAKKKGTAKIMVKAKRGKAKTTLKVIVGTKIRSVRMSAATQDLLVGDSVQLTASVTPKKASYQKLRWTSSDRGVAVVENGKVNAISEGTATITAAAQDGTKKKAVCQIIVGKPGGRPSASDDPSGIQTPASSATVTNQPAIVPTDNPSGTQTENPGTDLPADPTGDPGSRPTAVPTDNPGGTQTENPGTDLPADPTGDPGSRPTADPTGDPGGRPTAVPTVVPGATATVKPTAVPTRKPDPTPTPKPVSLLVKDCDTMTISGLAGPISKPFSGVALYANDDEVKTSYRFEGTNKKYRIIVKGASNNDTAAGVSLYIGDKKKGAVSFTGTQLQEQVIDFKMQDDETGELEIFFKLETDNGSNDTYLNSFELILLGDIPEPPAAPVPAGGAAYNNSYRNLFMELGHTEEEIDSKVEEAWQKFFYGTEEERIYYPVEPDMAYIYTADTNDVRSEGMSYGMMICVQMDKQEEFNRLWKWAVTYMRHKDGERKGYFAWQCGTDGSKKDNNPASDGEEYFATALFFASARWGDGEGIYDYRAQAQEILDDMMSRTDSGGGVVNMFNSTHKMVVFVPYGNSASFTDPSYHLPAFYEVWAEMADKNNEFWSQAAEASRAYFKKATNATTGLGPDYSEFNGAPKNEGNHGDFRFDAWRIAGNIACDYAWWGKDDWATTYADRIQSFFAGYGVEDYGNQWSLDGKMLDKDHSPGLVAMNATAGLAASNKQAWAFLENFWNISPTTGTYRYYDGCLYMMGLLHCSGKFRAWLPDGTQPSISSTITADSTEFDKAETKQSPVRVTMTLNGNTLTQISCGGVVLVPNKDYTVSGSIVTISKEYLATLKTGTVAISFVFSAGRKATLNLKIKDTTPGTVPDPSSPFEQIGAASFTDSNAVSVKDGIVTFNSTDSWIAFDLDFGTDSDSVKDAVVYVKEPDNGGTVYVCIDNVSSKISDIYNLGGGTWKEASGNCWPKPSSGKRKVFVKVNKAGIQMQWLKFTK